MSTFYTEVQGASQDVTVPPGTTIVDPILVNPTLGTPASGNAVNLTGLSLTTGVTGVLPVANGGTGKSSLGSISDVGTDGINITGGSQATIENVTISQQKADATHNGYLSSSDWMTFNSKGSGSVTSVAVTVPAFLSVTGSPITTNGTLGISLSGTALPLANGGTGQTTKTAAFNALSPMSATGDIIYRDGSGNAVALPIGAAGTVVTSVGGVPAYATVPTGITGNGSLSLNNTQTVVNGTLGNATFGQPFSGPGYKKVVVYCNGLTGAVSYTFPTAFTNVAAFVSTNGLLVTLVTALSKTAMTVTGIASTGFIFIEGW